MSSRAALLRDTLEIALCDDRFPALFYDKLFAARPSLRPMFTRNSPGAQQKMFAQKLAAIVDSVDQPELLRAEARAIAKSHASYGIRPEMYGWVGEALIAALREAVGPGEWTAEAEAAWTEAYAAVAEAVLAEPPA
jgi:hemoglobin-like flavoprotein